MSFPFSSIVPSGKYIAIFDNTGEAKVLEQPLQKSLLGWNGTDWVPMDGTGDHPLCLPAMSAHNGTIKWIAGFDANSRMFRHLPAPTTQTFLGALNGNISWQALTVTGIPAGHGLLIRENDPATAAFVNGQGIVYINISGIPGPIANGMNGQLLAMVNGNPAWQSPPAGSVAAGVSSAGLSGISATNTSPSIVNITAPSITLTKANGDTVVATNVNVNADLTGSLGVGGLDVGTEAVSTWYAGYIVSDGTTTNAVLSANGTAPALTNLGSYEYFSAATIFRNDGSGNIIPFIQKSRSVWTRLQVWADPATITTSYAPISSGTLLTTIIPPNVKTVQGIVGGSQSANETQSIQISLAADTNGLATQYPVIRSASGSRDGFTESFSPFWNFPIIDPTNPQIFWKGGAVGSAKQRVVITGYTF